MNARLARLMFSSAISQNFVILRLARESGEPKDPSSFFLSLIAIFRRSANFTCHRVSFRKLFAPEKSAVHSCANNKNSVILSEAKDPSSFLLSLIPILGRTVNASRHKASRRKLCAPKKSAVRLSATNKNIVILSEAKDPSFFSLSTTAILGVLFPARPQWLLSSIFSPPFSVPLCLRGKSLFAGARQ